MLRMEEWSQWFVQKKRYIEKIIQYILQTSDNFWKRHFLLNCKKVTRIVIANVQQYRWRYISLWSWLEGIKHWRLDGETKIYFCPSKSPHSKKSPHNSLSSFYSSKIFWIDVVKHLDASLNESKPSVKFKIVTAHSLGSGSGSSASTTS